MKVKINVRRKGDSEKVLKNLIKTLGSVDILVGIPKDTSPYPDGTSTAMVAAVHEFGSPKKGIPERSFLRSAIEENQDKYIDMAKKGLQKITHDIGSGANAQPQTLKRVAGLIGLQSAGDVQQKIKDLKDPPLSPRTIARRKDKSDNPLVDTGHLVQSIRHEVREKA